MTLSIVYSFNKYGVSTHHVLGPGLDARYKNEQKRQKSCPCEALLLVGDDRHLMRLRISSEAFCDYVCLIAPDILIRAPLRMCLLHPQGENVPVHEATVTYAGVVVEWGGGGHGPRRWDRKNVDDLCFV